MNALNRYSIALSVLATTLSFSANAMQAALPGSGALAPAPAPAPVIRPVAPTRVIIPVPSIPNRSVSCRSLGAFSYTPPTDNTQWLSLGGTTLSSTITRSPTCATSDCSSIKSEVGSTITVRNTTIQFWQYLYRDGNTLYYILYDKDNSKHQSFISFEEGLDPRTAPGNFDGLMGYFLEPNRPDPEYIPVTCSNQSAPIACPSISCPSIPPGYRYAPIPTPTNGTCPTTCPAVQKPITMGPPLAN